MERWLIRHPDGREAELEGEHRGQVWKHLKAEGWERIVLRPGEAPPPRLVTVPPPAVEAAPPPVPESPAPVREEGRADG